MAIDGNNDDVKERHIQLVKKRGKVKALDEELYSKWRASEREEPVRHPPLSRTVFQQRRTLEIFTCPGSDTQKEG